MVKQAVGQQTPHESAALHVTGKAQYIDDLPLPADTLYAALGVTEIAAGSVSQINLDAVLAAPGVVDLLSFDQIPGLKDVGPVFPGDPLLVDSQVSFYGQPLFAVVATDELSARKAAKLAQIHYKSTEAILTIAEAKAQQARVRPAHQMLKGEPETAFASAKHLFRGSLEIGGQEHLYLEGQVSAAIPTETGGVHVFSSTQHPSEVQKLVAEVLHIPFHEVVVEVRRMGGAFGGKETQAAPWACIAAILAVRTGRAVKLRLPRATDMQLTGKRHPFENDYRVATDDQGRIQAVEFEINGDCGHSPDLSDAIVDRAMFHADNAYDYPNARILGERWKTNKVSNTAFRGFGGPQGMLSCEAMMDDIARALKMDPLDLRYANLYPAATDGGGTTPYHQSVDGAPIREILERLESSCDYRDRRQEITKHNASTPRYLKGLALTPVKFGISFTVTHLNQAGVLIHVYTDGTVLVSQAGTEMGQGLHTKVAQVVASVFGIDTQQVKLSSTRTDKVPNTSPTAASSGSDLNGMAAQQGANQIRERLVEFLSQREGVSPDAIQFEAGRVSWDGGSLSFAELSEQAYMARISLSATGFYKTPEIFYDRSKASGRPFYYFALGAACSEVEVDRVTGESRVTRVDILHDCGHSLNPALDKGQVEGGYIQGLGWLTTEELVWNDQGRLLTNSPATYKIPAISDMPPVFNVELFDQPNPEATIYRSKAVGEPPLMLAISAWCAIRDAISSLSGYKESPVLKAPATPEAVFNAIRRTIKDIG